MADFPYNCDDVTVGRELKSCRDFTPSYAEGDQAAYLKHVAHCKTLRGDLGAFREAGCKRVGHVRIPKGRLAFVRPGTYHPKDPEVWQEKGYDPDPQAKEPFERHEVTEATDKRWADHLPDLDARTQSPKLRRNSSTRKKRERVEDLSIQIAEGLDTYIVQSGQKGRPRVLLPKHTFPLTQAGVPEKAARLLAEKLGGQVVRRRGKKHPSPLDRVQAAFGGADLATWSPYDVPAFDFLSADLRTLRGPMRKYRKLFQAVKDQITPKVLRAARTGRRRVGFLPVWEAYSTSQTGGSRHLKLTSTTPLLPNTPADFLHLLGPALSRPGTITFIVGDPAPVKIDLQHSMLMGSLGSSGAADYTTLRGFTITELPGVVAQRVVSSRRRRRGRQRAPSSTAQRNPHMARRPKKKKARRNPKHSYHPDALSGDSTLNRLTDWYYPGTIWDWYEAGAYDQYNVSVPVNRRNPSKKRRKAKRNAGKRPLTPAQLAAGFGGKAAMRKARNNPEFSKRTRVKRRPYWPRNSEYEQVWGPYGQGTPLPPNRRNPNNRAQLKSVPGVMSFRKSEEYKGWSKSKQRTFNLTYATEKEYRSRGEAVAIAYEAALGAKNNPSKKAAGVWRFPTPCAICGGSMQGEEYRVLPNRKGPRGGKVRAHSNCG